MGTQQLLLIVIGTVLIGIMAAVGIFMFKDQASATNRDQISNDLLQLASQAQSYYRKPGVYGGGGNSFGGLSMTRMMLKPENINGVYSLQPDPAPSTASSVKFTGIGTEIGSNGVDKVRLTTTVWLDSILIVAEN